MRLKVRCQICGRVGEVETSKLGEKFFSHRLSEFIDVKTHSDYEIWLCKICDAEVEAYYEWEKYYPPLIESLKLSKEEVEAYEWEEMIKDNSIRGGEAK